MSESLRSSTTQEMIQDSKLSGKTHTLQMQFALNL
jgi:hypothetical protein